MHKFLLRTIGCSAFLILPNLQAAAQGTWTKKADYPGRFSWSCADVSLNAKGYIGAGMRNIRDPTTDTWSQIADFPVARDAGIGFSK